MSLWGNIDTASGNLKPIYANTASDKNHRANTVFGVSVTEKANTMGVGPGVPHAGWNIIKLGVGPVLSVALANAGAGVNTGGGYLVISTQYGSGANISYTTANSQNTLQSFSTNPAWNVIASLTVNAGGTYNTTPAVTFTGANSIRPLFTVTMGGRANRVSSETLVAMGSMIGDNAGDDYILPGT